MATKHQKPKNPAKKVEKPGGNQPQAKPVKVPIKSPVFSKVLVDKSGLRVNVNAGPREFAGGLGTNRISFFNPSGEILVFLKTQMNTNGAVYMETVSFKGLEKALEYVADFGPSQASRFCKRAIELYKESHYHVFTFNLKNWSKADSENASKHPFLVTAGGGGRQDRSYSGGSGGPGNTGANPHKLLDRAPTKPDTTQNTSEVKDPHGDQLKLQGATGSGSYPITTN